MEKRSKIADAPKNVIALPKEGESHNLKSLFKIDGGDFALIANAMGIGQEFSR